MSSYCLMRVGHATLDEALEAAALLISETPDACTQVYAWRYADDSYRVQVTFLAASAPEAQAAPQAASSGSTPGGGTPPGSANDSPTKSKAPVTQGLGTHTPSSP